MEHRYVLRDTKPQKLIRPFLISSGTTCQGYSQPLQRVMTDFGADNSFARAVLKVKEHYGIDLPTSGIRKVTLKHAKQLEEKESHKLSQIKDIYGKSYRKELKPGVAQIISETDGCMLPIVKPNSKAKDKRKKKELYYKEAKLALSYKQGSATPIFAATMKNCETAGQCLRLTANEAGLGINTAIHAVGDGALWITNQLKDKFGDLNQVNYLIDFYHLSEYLSAASKEIYEESWQRRWVQKQANRLKNNEISKVLADLAKYDLNNEESAVTQCNRYIKNRLEQLDYKKAIDQELPIGSGRIEGGHRHVIQARLKISGAWWLEESAQSMLALRTARVNNKWNDYWKVAA